MEKAKTRKEPRRASADAMSRKGNQVRTKILAEALRLFGEHGYAAVSTREIADKSGVTLPALQYYFGGKEKLYLACASEVVERFASVAKSQAQHAAAVLENGSEARLLRSALGDLLTAVARAMILESQAMRWGAFGMRELLDPGLGFDTLFKDLWEPGIDLIARLIARIRGKKAPSVEHRIEAMMMTTSISTFSNGRLIAEHLLGWHELRQEQLAQIERILRAQVERI